MSNTNQTLMNAVQNVLVIKDTLTVKITQSLRNIFYRETTVRFLLIGAPDSFMSILVTLERLIIVRWISGGGWMKFVKILKRGRKVFTSGQTLLTFEHKKLKWVVQFVQTRFYYELKTSKFWWDFVFMIYPNKFYWSLLSV